MGKKILLYKLASELVQQLEEDEEEYEQEYDDNIEYVTLDNGDDGRALLAEYNAILEQFTINQIIERQKLAESQTNCVLSNLHKRQFRDTTGLTRLRAQGQLILMKKLLEEINDGPLSTHFQVRDSLDERLDILNDNLADVGTHCLSHQELLGLQITFVMFLLLTGETVNSLKDGTGREAERRRGRRREGRREGGWKKRRGGGNNIHL